MKQSWIFRGKSKNKYINPYGMIVITQIKINDILAAEISFLQEVVYKKVSE